MKSVYLLLFTMEVQVQLQLDLPKVVQLLLYLFLEIKLFGVRSLFVIAYRSINPMFLFFIIGDMIHKAGAGPKPIPHKELNIDNLRDAIKFAISPSAQEAAKKMAYQIHEDVNIYFSKIRPLHLLMLCVEWSAEGCRQFLQTSSTVKYEMRFGFIKIGSLVVY
jgi:hypothetical protein